MGLKDLGCLLCSITLILAPAILVFSVAFYAGNQLLSLVSLVVFVVFLFLFTRYWMVRIKRNASDTGGYNGIDGPSPY